MAINLNIQSNVYDVNVDVPLKDEQFMVDTNVWFYFTYSKGMPSSRPNLNAYPNYLAKALANQSQLLHSGLMLSELAHIIEKTERDIHSQVVGNDIRAKEFRHNYVPQMNSAILEIEASWLQVESMAAQVVINIDKNLTDNCMNMFKSVRLDGYDLMIIESMQNNGLTNIITDDGDYSIYPGINVYTSNRNVIAKARSQGKLVTR
ncbi:PIN domain-containing protein [Pantoea agglomerans]|uniref:PIN domain-containing protein n=1 Tax=Enterobacter agglomerans TaxID=549 RepID=UPI003BF4E86E